MNQQYSPTRLSRSLDGDGQVSHVWGLWYSTCCLPCFQPQVQMAVFQLLSWTWRSLASWNLWPSPPMAKALLALLLLLLCFPEAWAAKSALATYKWKSEGSLKRWKHSWWDLSDCLPPALFWLSHLGRLPPHT